MFNDEQNQPSTFVKDAQETSAAVYTLLTAFTEDQARKLVRNAGDGLRFEAWRKLSNELDPVTNMRRRTILASVQDPPRCEIFGPAKHSVGCAMRIGNESASLRSGAAKITIGAP